MLKIRSVDPTELPLLKGFAPQDWNTDLSAVFSFHYGLSYFHPVVAELEGQIVGCAQGLINGESGWLGNIIVLPDYRGRGIGHALTQDMVEFFRSHGCNSQILVATKLGEPIYRSLGFEVASHYIFLKRPPGPPASKQLPHIRRAGQRDFHAILSLDQLATGEERAPFLSRFLENAWIYKENGSEEIDGFFLPELGVGLVIARNIKAGIALLRKRLEQGKSTTVVPEGNTAALDFLCEIGFEEFNQAPRMVLGKELDWKPSWVFSRGAGYCG